MGNSAFETEDWSKPKTVTGIQTTFRGYRWTNLETNFSIFIIARSVEEARSNFKEVIKVYPHWGCFSPDLLKKQPYKIQEFTDCLLQREAEEWIKESNTQPYWLKDTQ